MAVNPKTLAKLTKARVLISKANLKKTGSNDFAKYRYYQLEDFLPEVMKVCEEVGLCPVATYGTETTSLSVYDTEIEDSYIRFYCDSVKALVRGAVDVQNEGARQTYLRRYLYMTAFEIAEEDTVEVDAQLKDEAAGQDMYRAELLNKLAKYGLTIQKLTAYKGSLANIPTDYLESQLRKREEAEQQKEQEAQA